MNATPGPAPVSAADCVAVDYFAVQRVADEFGIDYNKLCAAIRALRQEGEPVAWLVQSTAKDVFFGEEAAKRYAAAIGADAMPLYALTPSPKGPTTP
jgi:putative AlgH/UPF0301 family transcriptional regulator